MRPKEREEIRRSHGGAACRKVFYHVHRDHSSAEPVERDKNIGTRENYEKQISVRSAGNRIPVHEQFSTHTSEPLVRVIAQGARV